jgi:hypothetical protein
MRISVFGLGYVGAVSAACWPPTATVVGVDTNPLGRPSTEAAPRSSRQALARRSRPA